MDFTSSPFNPTFVGYLETLSISELITYLKPRCKSALFKKVEQILISTEENMLKSAEDSAKDFELCMSKLSALSMELEENKRKDSQGQDKLGKWELEKIATEILLEKYNAISDELREKVAHFEENLELQRFISSELTFTLEEKNKESLTLQDMLGKLECSKISTENELKGCKTTCKNFKEKVARIEEDSKSATERINVLTKDLETYKVRCSELLNALEEKKKENVMLEDKLLKVEIVKCNTESQLEKYITITDKHIEKVSHLEEDFSKLAIALEEKRKKSLELEDKICKLGSDKTATENELKGYKTICEKLKEEVTHSDTDFKSVTERINALTRDLEMYKVRCSELLITVEEKHKDNVTLEDKVASKENEFKIVYERERTATERVDFLGKDLEMYKAKHYELSIVLEEKNKECGELKGELDKLEKDKLVTENDLKGYMVICDKLNGKIACLEEDSRIVLERERTAMERVKFLSDELEKIKKDTDQKLIKLDEENKDLKCAKRRAEDELEVRKKRFKLFETQVKDNLEQET